MPTRYELSDYTSHQVRQRSPSSTASADSASPDCVDTCSPWTAPLNSAAISRAMAIPSAVAADVAAMVKARHHVRETDGVDVEHRGRVGIVADPPRVARDEQHVAQAHRVRAEQV